MSQRKKEAPAHDKLQLYPNNAASYNVAL